MNDAALSCLVERDMVSEQIFKVYNCLKNKCMTMTIMEEELKTTDTTVVAAA